MPDGIVVVITLLVLAILVAIMLPMAQKVAAASGVDPFVDMPSNRRQYIQTGQARFNKFSDTNDITKGNFAGADTRFEMAATNRDLQEISQTADMVADPYAPTLQGVRNAPTQFKVAPPSNLLSAARRCEAKKGRDACSALGTGDMNGCGVCIKGGTAYNDPDKEGRHIGGMLILPDDKAGAEDDARGTGRPPLYKPTLGECPDGYFFVNKADCEKAVNRQDCTEAGESGGFEGGRNIEGRPVIDKCAAAPLSGDTTYVFDPKNRNFNLGLRVIPPTGAEVTISVNGGAASSSIKNETVYPINGVKEGQELTVSVSMPTPFVSKDGVERRAVLLQWQGLDVANRTGAFESSIVSVNGMRANEENIFMNLRKFGTFAKSTQIAEPRGVVGSKMLLTTPWIWSNMSSSKTVNFVVKVPGTFLNPFYPEDRVVAPRGPLITQKATMELLRASPCMKVDQKPGKYSFACLKTLFIAAGGDFYRGKIVNDGLEKLNRIGDGSAETISGYLTGLYTLATRGKTPEGIKATMTQINDAAMKMFGFELVSPCEDIMENEDGGIMLVAKVGGLEADCLDYLWANTGNDRSRGDEDGSRNSTLRNTYTSIWDRYSGLRSNEGTKKEREASPFTTCQRTGTLAPIGKDGKVNATAVYEANTKGSLSAIQDYYNNIYKAANYLGGDKQGAKAAEHTAALEKCYGVKRSSPATAARVKCPTPPLVRIGNRISISPFAFPTMFARHAGYVMWTHPNDGSPLFRADASFKIVAPLSGTPGAVSLEAVNFPGFYVTHSWYRVLIQNVNRSWSRVKETEWFVRPARNGNSECVSFENNWGGGGWFIGKVGNEVRLVQQSAGVDNISWLARPALG